MRNCKDCNETFKPIGRERICPECKLQRSIDKQETRDTRKES